MLLQLTILPDFLLKEVSNIQTISIPKAARPGKPQDNIEHHGRAKKEKVIQIRFSRPSLRISSDHRAVYSGVGSFCMDNSRSSVSKKRSV